MNIVLLNIERGKLKNNCVRFDFNMDLMKRIGFSIGLKGDNGEQISEYKIEYDYDRNCINITDIYSGKTVASLQNGLISIAIRQNIVNFYCDMIYECSCNVSNDMYIINDMCSVIAYIKSDYNIKYIRDVVNVTIN